MITGIAHLCLSVKNLDAMEKFYVDALGLQHAFDFFDDEGHRYGVYIRVGNRTFIELFEGRDDGDAKGQAYRHICLEVSDINRMVDDLRSRGVQATDPVLGSDNSWQSWIADPEGNAIELHGYTPESMQAEYL